MKITPGEEALKAIKPGDRVYIHGGAATPTYLLDKLAERADELWNVEMVRWSDYSNWYRRNSRRCAELAYGSQGTGSSYGDVFRWHYTAHRKRDHYKSAQEEVQG